jgi:hypothetical protein
MVTCFVAHSRDPPCNSAALTVVSHRKASRQADGSCERPGAPQFYRPHIYYLLFAICYSGRSFRRVPASFLNQLKIAEIKRRLIYGEAANGDPG